MRKIFTIAIALLLMSWSANAQNFTKRIVVPFDEKLSDPQAEWVSLNQDNLLDFVVAGTADGEFKILSYDNDLVIQNTTLTGMKTGYIQLADWNRDNKIDILVSGKTLNDADALFCFINNGDFTFTKQSQKIIDYSGQFRTGDLDGDGNTDILTFEQNTIRIYNTTGMMKFELTGMHPTDAAIFDMNNDGVNDFTVSGPSLTTIFIGKRYFKFERVNAPEPIDGVLSLADFDSDGLFDIVITNESESKTWRNGIDTLIADQTPGGAEKLQLFTGDMTADGITDIVTDTTVDNTNLVIQRIGDRDRDGDPDVVQVIDSIDNQWLKLYENTTATDNDRPSQPLIGFAISTFDKTFIFWQPATDDHTAVSTLTYDVWLGNAEGTLIAPSFDLSSRWRNVVRHGNAGTNTSMIVNGLTDDRYFYEIQAVDNAYNGSPTCNGNVVPCFDLVHQNVQACKNTEITLAGGTGAVWFSLSEGFLGETDDLTFVATVTDTLFAFVPQAADCDKNKVYVVHVNDGPQSEQQIIYACKDQVMILTIPDGWTNVTWDPGQEFIVTKADTVIARANSQGCDYKKEFFIKISTPSVTIAGDGFQVMKGNSVQLEATGTVEQWQWNPADGLDNPSIPNPTATPNMSTEYTVTGTDSVGCKATARTQVLVQETAFVPNLFTPNGDGKNDNLLIYGLTMSSKFNFRIFNREGSMVYETKDILHATNVGWDGSVRGTRQPNGIYYWRIDGEGTDGNKLLLNGKTTGSILLVH